MDTERRLTLQELYERDYEQGRARRLQSAEKMKEVFPLVAVAQPVVETAVVKLTNPKDAIGSTKVPLGLVPVSAMIEASLCLANGKGKYGGVNWRQAGVRSSIYIDAAMRHLQAWQEGEEYDDEGIHNLGAVIACAAILIDSQAIGNLNDDRPMSMPEVRKLLEAGSARLKAILARNSDKSPKHWTIADNKA